MKLDRQVLVCQHISCQNQGSASVLAAFQADPVTGVVVVASECQGQCNMGPTVRVLPDETWYCRVKPEDVPVICDQHLKANQPVVRLLHPRLHPRF
jgi:(2Fe-2S) ferredoxin